MLTDLARRGINELHVEAGHKLNGSLVREGLVDEFLVYMAPRLLGTGRELAAFGPLERLEDTLDLRYLSVDHSFKSTPYGDFHMGVEMETELRNHSVNGRVSSMRDLLGEDYLVAKRDGSLGGGGGAGIEWVTRPTSLAVHREKFVKLLVSDDQARELAWLLMNNEQARQLARRVIGSDVCGQVG